jgi:hypothetical protein
MKRVLPIGRVIPRSQRTGKKKRRAITKKEGTLKKLSTLHYLYLEVLFLYHIAESKSILEREKRPK